MQGETPAPPVFGKEVASGKICLKGGLSRACATKENIDYQESIAHHFVEIHIIRYLRALVPKALLWDVGR